MAILGCTHPGYTVKDGALVCASCGAPSPKAKLVNGEIVKIETVITCPHCKGKLTTSGKAVEEKAYNAHEDKRLKLHEDKKRRK